HRLHSTCVCTGAAALCGDHAWSAIAAERELAEQHLNNHTWNLAPKDSFSGQQQKTSWIGDTHVAWICCPFHLPKTRTRNVPGMNAPRGLGTCAVGGGGGARSDNGRKIRLVFRSSAMLRAPGAVCTVSIKAYSSAEFCRAIETVPSPFEM